jgi:hypothetical protein
MGTIKNAIMKTIHLKKGVEWSHRTLCILNIPQTMDNIQHITGKRCSYTAIFLLSRDKLFVRCHVNVYHHGNKAGQGYSWKELKREILRKNIILYGCSLVLMFQRTTAIVRSHIVKTSCLSPRHLLRVIAASSGAPCQAVGVPSACLRQNRLNLVMSCIIFHQPNHPCSLHMQLTVEMDTSSAGRFSDISLFKTQECLLTTFWNIERHTYALITYFKLCLVIKSSSWFIF